uniref:F-box domain-containing protein n=1 Tax=Erythrolobus australicus TaxID=1077150 RepID=A0A7S1TLN4_9RHOD
MGEKGCLQAGGQQPAQQRTQRGAPAAEGVPANEGDDQDDPAHDSDAPEHMRQLLQVAAQIYAAQPAARPSCKGNCFSDHTAVAGLSLAMVGGSNGAACTSAHSNFTLSGSEEGKDCGACPDGNRQIAAHEPDSVMKLVTELQAIISYVHDKPALQQCGASFVRDRLRTLLVKSASEAQSAIAAEDSKFSTALAAKVPGAAQRSIDALPDDVVRHMLGMLDGESLSAAQATCRRWRRFVSHAALWKSLCVANWRALDTDAALWRMLCRTAAPEILENFDSRWQLGYPLIAKLASWRVRLQKTGRFICNLVAHQVSGRPLVGGSMPETLVVERRFNVLHLETFVLPESAVLYYEPATIADEAGFEEFIEYLTKRTRAGLALDEQRRFIFIPPCEYASANLDYDGSALLGIVQTAYPPLVA